MKLKSLIAAAFLLSLTSLAQAQNFNLKDFLQRPKRKALESENLSLKTALDSLQSLVDSLQMRRYLEDSELIAVMEGN